MVADADMAEDAVYCSWPHAGASAFKPAFAWEKRLLKVLKGLAEYLDLSLGDLLEGIALHALENKPPFKPLTLDKVAQLRRVYGLDLVAADSHRLRDRGETQTQRSFVVQ